MLRGKDGDKPKTLQEKSALCSREWHQKVALILKDAGIYPKMKMTPAKWQHFDDAINLVAEEYKKLFGRIGTTPLLFVKGGKQKPRYMLDTDELWVMYKPALWQMGGSQHSWDEHISTMQRTKSSLLEAQSEMLLQEKTLPLQEWHGVTQGTWYVDRKREGDELETFTRDKGKGKGKGKSKDKEKKSDGADRMMAESKDKDNFKPVVGFGFVQRLDAETDGPVIIAKTWRAQRIMQVMLKEHVITKSYMCLVHGKLENKIHCVKTKFAELGDDASTQIMIKHDQDNDPFFEFTADGHWGTGDGSTNHKGKRSIRMAISFFKPLAYYYRKEDNSHYSLVYVNILSGITHQVRITLQSVGHPLVADDRYLPTQEAKEDLRWCPRNFLCEVRQDWFDLLGPFKEPERRQYRRVSIENPLPKLFQDVLTNKLQLVEQLDMSADLFTGAQYWALGDEQLMAQHPKEASYRRKVIRWGQRRRIHLDALDRLLLLPKDQIDGVLNTYTPPKEDKERWICPICMAFNYPNGYNDDAGAEAVCQGAAGITKCSGRRIVPEDHVFPLGWKDWLQDPTIHMLMIVNKLWLEARTKILKEDRPSWEKTRSEPEGTKPTPDILLVLEAALTLDAKEGGQGIAEGDLHSIAGLRGIKLPLGDPPPESAVRRVRLPGTGEGAQWNYTLRGSQLLKLTENFNVKSKKLKGPIEFPKMTYADVPQRMRPSREELVKQNKVKVEDELDKLVEARIEKQQREKLKLAEKDGKKRQRAKEWVKVEAKTAPGTFYYFDTATGATQTDEPEDFKEAVVQYAWERRESSKSPGNFYYYNVKTGDTQMDRPKGVRIKNDDLKAAQWEKADGATPPKLENKWERKESKSSKGHFYYFNTSTGANEMQPPVVDLPWKLLESSSKRGQWYYFNDETGAHAMDPPPGARPAPTAVAPAAKKARVESAAPPASINVALPEGWAKKTSDKYQGKVYYIHERTGKSSWTWPPPLKDHWEKKTSATHANKFYYVNTVSGETSWTVPA